MSMVKPYHEKKCSELHLCCSGFTLADSVSKNDLLIRNAPIEGEDENWNWSNSNDSTKMEVWSDKVSENLKFISLDPPLEFQDNPVPFFVEKFATDFVVKLISDAFLVSCKITWSIPCSQDCHMSDSLPVEGSLGWKGLRLCWTPELLPLKNSLPPCLSASHNSLSTISSSNLDDTSFIKSAVSHDVLTTRQISDIYNVPFDSDIYAVPVDVVQRNSSADHSGERCYRSPGSTSDHYMLSVRADNKDSSLKQGGRRDPRKCHSESVEPIHVTVEEVRQYLHRLYSNTNESNESSKNFPETIKRLKNPFKSLQNNISSENNQLNSLKTKRNYIVSGKSKKAKENVDTLVRDYKNEKFKKSLTCRPSFSTNIKETLCNIFRIKKLPSTDHCLGRKDVDPRSDEVGIRLSGHDDQNPPSPITKPPFTKRALPPLPGLEDNHGEIIVTDSTPLPSPEELPPPLPPPPPPLPPPPRPFRFKELPNSVDFIASIEKVKDYGWYWGPISGVAAEKILSNEPDGSFIVRDSSDDYYIFSLTFKLNSIIRHVRIEHDKGNFSFGNSTRFKSHTIVDFIESAVEHSRSGRYLFFLHRRPVLGPMRVQLLHPVSRFKEVQSLQHMCRFVILKTVRRDLIQYLPLPKRILDYLSTQHYYAEHLVDDEGKDSLREDLDQLLPFRQEVFS